MKGIRKRIPFRDGAPVEYVVDLSRRGGSQASATDLVRFAHPAALAGSGAE